MYAWFVQVSAPPPNQATTFPTELFSIFTPSIPLLRGKLHITRNLCAVIFHFLCFFPGKIHFYSTNLPHEKCKENRLPNFFSFFLVFGLVWCFALMEHANMCEWHFTSAAATTRTSEYSTSVMWWNKMAAHSAFISFSSSPPEWNDDRDTHLHCQSKRNSFSHSGNFNHK